MYVWIQYKWMYFDNNYFTDYKISDDLNNYSMRLH